MGRLIDWFDDRTGIRRLAHEALYERIPGGARWRYVWGSTLVFVFVVQVITGIFLWMYYSPSAQTAWESVYYIEHEVSGGWLVRGTHHYAAQAMVMLLMLHLLQVVIDGAYRAPREINFWLGLILMLIVLKLALTGYLLPWDQKGYWATQVATKIVASTPLFGEQLQTLIVGGKEYGHQTLTRFFALHAGVLPGMLVLFLVLHLALFRRHGVMAKEPLRRPDTTFWPDQMLRDGVASLAILAAIGGLAVFARAELGAPADPATPYDAARPEWYFLFLFQFLKYFPGESGMRIAAIYIPTGLLAYLFFMPIIGRIRIGHWLNVAVLFVLIGGAGWLTYAALNQDYRALLLDEKDVAKMEDDLPAYLLGEQAESAMTAIKQDVANNGQQSEYASKPILEQIELYLKKNKDIARGDFEVRAATFRAYQKSKSYLFAANRAEADAEHAQELSEQGIPPTGALSQFRADAAIRGRQLFVQHCSSCHSHVEKGKLPWEADLATVATENPTAANLNRFASREWIAGLFDAEQIASKHYFGNTPFADGEMAEFVKETLPEFELEDEELQQIVMALSAEAQLKYQSEADEMDTDAIKVGRENITETCVDCHKFHDEDLGGTGPDLTGYGSDAWLKAFIDDPGHGRFYGDSNVMPAFGEVKGSDQPARLSNDEKDVIIKWLRRQAR